MEFGPTVAARTTFTNEGLHLLNHFPFQEMYDELNEYSSNFSCGRLEAIFNI